MPAKRRPARKDPEPQPLNVVREMRQWADALLKAAGTAGKAVNLAAGAMRAVNDVATPLTRTGVALKDLREAAGLSVRELSAAAGIGDAKLLASIEGGRAAIPFEIVLRLAAVLGRNDPIPTILRLTRASNPQLAAAIAALGVGRLVVHAEREREFLNLFRAEDELRRLTDAEFKAFLEYMRGAVKLATAYRKPK